MLLVKPYLGCNRACKYCFEGNWREEAQPAMDYDIEKVIQSMQENLNGSTLACLHGGEPLMIPKEDIEKILQKGHQLCGRTAIQTNGFTLDEDHIAIFKRYNTSVGFSYDGFGDLNEARMNESEAEFIWDKIKTVKETGLRTTLITVVSKANAGTPDKLQRLKRFLIEAKKLGITGGRLNPCDHPDWTIPIETLSQVYKDLALFVMENNLQWGPFIDMWNSLRRRGPVVCVFRDCNPFKTQAATVIMGDGSVTNCIKMAIKTDFKRHDGPNPRAEKLLTKTQDEGGCLKCRWWTNCYGGCPSCGIEGNWENRTIFCEMYKTVFELYSNMQRWQNIQGPPGRN